MKLSIKVESEGEEQWRGRLFQMVSAANEESSSTDLFVMDLLVMDLFVTDLFVD